MHIGIGLGLFRPRAAGAVAATAPAVMAAPLVTPATRTAMTVTRAAAPANGGSPITSYDLRHSTDQVTWTVVAGISAAQAVSGLLDGTVYYVQTRAVNAAGAALWSPSGLYATFAGVTAINAEGWSAAVTAPPRIRQRVQKGDSATGSWPFVRWFHKQDLPQRQRREPAHEVGHHGGADI